MTGRPSALAQLWAVALLTLKEAVRRKAFTILIIFTVIMVSSAFFFPAVKPIDRLRLIQLWSLRATVLFSAIVAIFLAGFSIPSDMEQRRVYTLLTKPVSKVVFFAGRVLGFMIMLAAFVAVMGLVSVIYVRVVQAAGGKEFPELKADPRVWPDEFAGGESSEELGDRRVLLDQSSKNEFVYLFRGLGEKSMPAAGRGEITLRITGVAGVRFAGNMQLTIGGQVQPVMNLKTASPSTFPLDKTLIGKDGTLEIKVRAVTKDLLVGGDPDSVVVYTAPELYEYNYFKGMVLLFCHGLVVLSVTLMASTFLGAPIAILLGIFVFLLSMMHGFIDEGVRDIDQSLKKRDEAIQAGERPPPTPENLPPWLLKTSTGISTYALIVIGDYRTYDFSPLLLHDLSVSSREIVPALQDMAIRVIILVLLGMGVIYFKEFE